MIYLPSIEHIYMGASGVTKIMLGDEQVWPYVDPIEIPDYISGNTLAFKYLGARHPSMNNSGVSLFDFYTYGTGYTHTHLFSDYDGNDLIPTNAVVERYSYMTSYYVPFNEDGWAVFEFDRPIHTVYCQTDSPSDMYLFAVVPSSVKVLAGFYGLVNSITIEGLVNRYYIPEGVEVLSGACVCMNGQFAEGSVHIPSTVTTIGYGDRDDGSGNTRNALYKYLPDSPKLFYYNGTYDEYNNITWLGSRKRTYQGKSRYAGYPVKCTDGVFWNPRPDYIANGRDSTSGSPRNVWFDSGFIASADTCMEIKVANVNFTPNANQNILGAAGVSASQHFALLFPRNDTYHICYIRYNGRFAQSTSADYAIPNKPYVCTMWKDGGTLKLDVDGTLITGSTPSAATTAPAVSLYFFARNQDGTINTATRCYGGCKIYYAKIYDYYGGTLLHHFVPHIDENLEACFKDLVTGNIIHNLGTDTPVYGYDE